MQNPRPRFFSSSKKTLLIKLVSVLGFGGMVGFCVLGCEKQAPVGKDVVQDSEQVKADVKVEANAQDSVPVDVVVELVVEDLAPAVDVLEPTPATEVLAPPPVVDSEPIMAPKYGVIPPNKRPPAPADEMAVRYGVVMPIPGR